MCGILGFTQYEARPSQIIAAAILASKMVDRGRQSWGTTNGWTVTKAVGSITSANLMSTHIGEASQSPFGVMFAHTRASSHGSVSAENAHPHTLVSDNGQHQIIGVHNGTITHPCMIQQNTKKWEVDTQLIYDRLVNDGLTTNLEGTGVLVYMLDGEHLRFLRFNSTNLYIANDLDTGGLIWASTETAVKEAAAMAGIKLGAEIKTEPETIYQVAVDPNTKLHTLVVVGERKFARPIQTSYTDRSGATQFAGAYSGCGYSPSHTKGTCVVCNSLKEMDTGLGLCELCLEIALDKNNSINYESFLWFGHYMPTVVEEVSDAPTEDESTEANPKLVQAALMSATEWAEQVGFGRYIGHTE
jgi:hypothetical protein